jgi:hypothetical protein
MAENKSKAQLHQLLPAETDLQAKLKKIFSETVGVFGKKERFSGHTRRLKMFDEARAAEETVEVQEITTTVRDKLRYVGTHAIQYWDAFYQKERTNQDARADIVVEGQVIASDIPATALLGFETRLRDLRDVYQTVPTLAPGIKWVPVEGSDTFRSDTPDDRMKTEKSLKFEIVTGATKEHKAQYEKWSADAAIGKYSTEYTSGMITPERKHQLLDRIEKLIIAVKQARQRANSTEVVSVKIGQAFYDSINNR